MNPGRPPIDNSIEEEVAALLARLPELVAPEPLSYNEWREMVGLEPEVEVSEPLEPEDVRPV